MSKVKIIFWLLILVVLGVIFYQNQDLFLNEQSISINLLVKEYSADNIPNAIFFFGFFLVGLLIAYFSSLAERYKSKKTIKMLNAAIDSHRQEISSMQSEVASLRTGETGEKEETDQTSG
jgi:uncharacterized integral membrane protein